ncbi:hypothetical protein CEXT_234741 [Caerostris extrusa]|uniref:Maturase K n=1 Tax=Caerostris extrusa TaxID=172846 RepID=A0AAV4WAN3_CAEEX|nr:hypothetical protein CEXT_234741 [Caerostris extrusa]
MEEPGYLIAWFISSLELKEFVLQFSRYLRYGTKWHQPQSIRRVLSLYRKNEKKNHSLEKWLNGSIKKDFFRRVKMLYFFHLILKSPWFRSAYY